MKAALPPALHPLLPLVRLFYGPYFSFKLKTFSVARLMSDLAGRDLLFIASAEPSDRHDEVKGLYASLPQGSAGDANFLELKASVVSGLYAEDKQKYDEAILKFFSTYLAHAARPAGASKKIQVLEQ